MRLLKREKSGWLRNGYIFSLTKFNPRDMPCEYAILSHRWGPDEVTYQDIETGSARAKAKAGYRKLKFCAAQAARDGLVYFWIDTCCIDKSDGVEIQTAINSMFKWYAGARKCYVYLPDVSTNLSTSRVVAQTDWDQAFRTSTWFTRGWTLQELLAPKVVEFFSVEGRKLGDKQSLEGLINQVTGVPIEVLQGKPLSEVDEKERQSWTDRRETTIEEDAVYCLLGIFDVFMPLNYGEGKQRATTRLHKEIKGRSQPAVSFAVDTPLSVPFERNRNFTGRETQLAELKAKVVTTDRTSKIAVTGLGGVGKTHLVLELLYRINEQHKDYLIMWISSATTASIQQGYLAVARQLGVAGHEDQAADVKKLVQDHLSRGDVGSWLLVFDNADDISLWTAVSTTSRADMGAGAEVSLNQISDRSCRLIDYLPRNKRGCIIFTTRDKKAAVELAQQDIITVPAMSEGAAMQLLRISLINSETVLNNTREASALLEALTNLPLAITQAAAYINANESTLADYLSLIEEQKDEAIDILSEGFEDPGRYQDVEHVKNPVATTWLISFDRIQRSDPLATEYLSFMACVHPRNIPESLLSPGPSRKRRLDAIGTLKAYSFLSERPEQSSLDLHRLVYLATRNWLRKEGSLNQWMQTAIVRLAEVFPNDDHENRTTWRTYFPHVHQVLESGLIRADEEQRMALMGRYGDCLSSDGRWREAETTYATLLGIQRAKFGPDHPVTLASIGNLASTYRDQGRWQEAEQLQIQVVETSKAKLGPDHLDTLASIHILALTYSDQGRWQEAEQLQIQVMETSKAKLGLDHPNTLTSMGNLVLTYRDQGRWQEAEQLQIQVVETSKTTLGPDHPDTLTSIHNLALTYRDQGRWQEAEQLQIQVVETSKTTLGPDHPDTLTSIHNLALTYRDQGRWQEAEQLQIQEMETSKAKLGPDHPNTLTSMHNLAFTLKDLARYTEAIQLMSDCYQRQIRVLGASHPYTVSSAEKLAIWEAEHPSTRTDTAIEEDLP